MISPVVNTAHVLLILISSICLLDFAGHFYNIIQVYRSLFFLTPMTLTNTASGTSPAGTMTPPSLLHDPGAWVLPRVSHVVPFLVNQFYG